MTVETASAQNTSRPTATESKHAKGKTGDAHGQGADGLGGFMAILASMDPSDLAVPKGSEVHLTGNGLGAVALAALQRASAALKGVAADAEAVGLTDPANGSGAAGTVADLAKLLHDGEVVLDASAPPPPIDVPRQPDLPLDTSVLLAQAAQWIAAAGPSLEQSQPKGVNAMATSLAGVGKPEGTALVHAALGEIASELAGKVGKAQKDVAERLAAAQAASAEPTASKAPAAAETRQAPFLQKTVDAPPNPTAAALTAAVVTPPSRREDMVRERSVFRSTAPDINSPLQTYAPAATTGSFANAPAQVTSMDTYVAEKVAYWISNDVQNAEMKLEGIGELPVEVSIRMQGNEAHIAFRSDELHARSVLENASEHLKDMLQREGVVLTGVSVGTAGAGDASSQERKSRQGARQAGVASVQPARAESVAGSPRSTGGALDLFV